MQEYKFCPQCGAEQSEAVGRYEVIDCDECDELSEVL